MPEGIPPFVGCAVCMAYVRRRGHIIQPLIAKYARLDGMRPIRKAHIFAVGLHARHLSGKAL